MNIPYTATPGLFLLLPLHNLLAQIYMTRRVLCGSQFHEKLIFRRELRAYFLTIKREEQQESCMLNMNIEYLGIVDIAIRVAVALVAGLLIGFERELSHHPAGLKTHSLVCMGAALTGLITSEMALMVTKFTEYAAESAAYGRVNLDISRIAAGVVTGIGFIGAGCIMKSKDGTIVTGITTAATLWVTANIGFAIGMGYLWMSLLVVTVVIVSNLVIKYVEDNILKKNKYRTIELMTANKNETMQFIEGYCEARRIKIKDFEYVGQVKGFEGNEMLYNLRYTLRTPSGMSFLIVMSDLAKNDLIIQLAEYGIRDKKNVKNSTEEITK